MSVADGRGEVGVVRPPAEDAEVELVRGKCGWNRKKNRKILEIVILGFQHYTVIFIIIHLKI